MLSSGTGDRIAGGAIGDCYGVNGDDVLDAVGIRWNGAWIDARDIVPVYCFFLHSWVFCCIVIGVEKQSARLHP